MSQFKEAPREYQTGVRYSDDKKLLLDFNVLKKSDTYQAKIVRRPREVNIEIDLVKNTQKKPNPHYSEKGSYESTKEGNLQWVPLPEEQQDKDRYIQVIVRHRIQFIDRSSDPTKALMNEYEDSITEKMTPAEKKRVKANIKNPSYGGGRLPHLIDQYERIAMLAGVTEKTLNQDLTNIQKEKQMKSSRIVSDD